eukprot:TRINITY_DN100498_c0_g1_i1.p2 TRINITY_DN100498_c0_g1~~TRINITY_DN100498_c0_g1_i1.p2  ORF type:complete len:128 (-),score=18.98 TRINITY_DN100498_c0_g1_i1:45-428(-)
MFVSGLIIRTQPFKSSHDHTCPKSSSMPVGDLVVTYLTISPTYCVQGWYLYALGVLRRMRGLGVVAAAGGKLWLGVGGGGGTFYMYVYPHRFGATGYWGLIWPALGCGIGAPTGRWVGGKSWVQVGS